MNIPGFTTTALLMLHGTIQAALTLDDSLPAGREKAYGVREFRDWRTLLLRGGVCQLQTYRTVDQRAELRTVSRAPVESQRELL
jgi:hypothetical protein